MKIKLILLLITYSLLPALPVIAQNENGFTNKAEATNIMSNGEKNGKWVEYLDSNGHATTITGAIKYYSLTYYVLGKAAGIRRAYYKDGHLCSETPYVNGKVNGVMKMYYENGKLQSQYPFNFDILNGIATEYYADGEWYETTYVNGIVNGYRKLYYASGALAVEVPYVNGKANGVEKAYYQNGNLYTETIYTNGVKGAVKKYDDMSAGAATTAGNNQEGFTNKYEAQNQKMNGLKEGKWIEYYDKDFKVADNVNATYYSLAIYHNDYIYGKMRWYYKSGNLCMELPYRDGKLNGVVNYYYENGKLKSETIYTDGVKGTMKTYKEDGTQVN